jgi:hypothetical protein
MVLKKVIINVWSGLEQVPMHFSEIPGHEVHVLKKDVFKIWSGFWRIFAKSNNIT